MTTEAHTETSARPSDKSSRWAPWWIYVLVIVPANVSKELLIAGDTDWWLRSALTALVLVGGIVLITAVYRLGRDERTP
jgi:membrane protein YdbS with pleckstrin-like domain